MTETPLILATLAWRLMKFVEKKIWLFDLNCTGINMYSSPHGGSRHSVIAFGTYKALQDRQ